MIKIIKKEEVKEKNRNVLFCYSNCEDQTNDLFVTTSNYPNRKTFKVGNEYVLRINLLLLINLIGNDADEDDGMMLKLMLPQYSLTDEI